MYHGIPCPKNFRGVKYQGLGWRDLNKSFEISIGSHGETMGSSSLLETISSMEMRLGVKLSVLTSFTCSESGGSRICFVADVWISSLEISDSGSSISGSEMGYVYEKYTKSNLVWTRWVICKLVASECDVNIWVWSNSVSITSIPKIVDFISWLTSIPLTSESIIVEVSVSAAVLDPDDLDFPT